MSNWEAYLTNAYQAIMFLSTEGWFEKGDDSVFQRLNHLYAWSEHSAQKVEKGTHQEEAPPCLWLTNDGLRNAQTLLTFAEMADVLELLADWADAVQDPRTTPRRSCRSAGEVRQ